MELFFILVLGSTCLYLLNAYRKLERRMANSETLALEKLNQQECALETARMRTLVLQSYVQDQTAVYDARTSEWLNAITQSVHIEKPASCMQELWAAEAREPCLLLGTAYPSPAHWTATCLTGRAVPLGSDMWRFEPLFVLYYVRDDNDCALRVTPSGANLRYELCDSRGWRDISKQERTHVFEEAA